MLNLIGKLWRKAPLSVRIPVSLARQNFSSSLISHHLRNPLRGSVLKTRFLASLPSTISTNRVAYGVERRLFSLFMRCLESAKHNSKWGRLTTWVVLRALRSYSRALHIVNQFVPNLFARAHHEVPIPSRMDWVHRTVNIFYFSACRKATHFDTISSRFFAYGNPNQAVKYARLARAKEPNALRHDAVLRCLLTLPNTQQEFYNESVKWAELYETDFIPFPVEELHLAAGRPLRIGLLCDYLDSVIGRFTLQPQLMHHKPENMRFFVYNFGEKNYLTHKICPQTRDVRSLSNDELHEWIRRDGIDILIEMNGRLRPGHKFSVLAKHPAPIQVSWYNLPATSGLKAIDYVIADDFAVPEGQDKFFTERIIRLEGSATGGWELPPTPQVEPSPAHHGNGVTFGCFSDMFKYNEDLLDAWAKILHGVPQSRLYLKNAQMDMPLIKAFVANEMAKRRIFPDRLILGGMSPYERMRELYGEVDIALDTFPFSSGSTSINALWQGVPVVCIGGPDWRGRSTSSIMANAELTDFIVGTPNEYVEKAITAAQNLDTLSNIRAGMRARLTETTYFRMDRYVPAFEKALNTMWENYLKENGVIPSNDSMVDKTDE